MKRKLGFSGSILSQEMSVRTTELALRSQYPLLRLAPSPSPATCPSDPPSPNFAYKRRIQSHFPFRTMHLEQT